MPLQGRLSIEHMCQLVVVSRRGFYRSLRQREPAEEVIGRQGRIAEAIRTILTAWE
jgi:hypothetical protein